MSKDPAKARRAATDPRRPGLRCNAPPGVYRPVVDPRRCEGKGDCIDVCPYDVFELGRLADEVLAAMPLVQRLKRRAQGRRIAQTPRAELCRACGLCVVACPHGAVELVGPVRGR